MSILQNCLLTEANRNRVCGVENIPFPIRQPERLLVDDLAILCDEDYSTEQPGFRSGFAEPPDGADFVIDGVVAFG